MALVMSGTRSILRIGGNEFEAHVPLIRQSCLKDFSSCQRLFLLKHILGLTPKTVIRSPAADTGTFWHEAMSAMYSTRDMSEVRRICFNHRDNILSRLYDLEAEDLTGTISEQIANVKMACAKGLAMAEIFFSHHPLTEDFEIVANEQPLLVPIEPGHGLARVKPDLILLARGKHWIVDHKSSSDKPEDVMVGKPWSYQTRLYSWAVRKHYGVPLGGFIFNKMQVPGIKLCGTDKKGAEKEGITPEEFYLRRVAEWYEKQPHMTIESQWFPCPGAEELDASLKALAYRVAHLFPVEKQQDLDVFFPKDGSCYTCRKFNRTCPYMAICDTQPEAWGPVISGFYTQNFEIPEEEKEEETHADS